MPFRSASMSALAYANGFTLWHYRTGDQIDEVLEEGYFNPHKQYIKPGDMIYINVPLSDKHFHGVFRQPYNAVTLSLFGVA